MGPAFSDPYFFGEEALVERSAVFWVVAERNIHWDANKIQKATYPIDFTTSTEELGILVQIIVSDGNMFLPKLRKQKNIGTPNFTL